MNDEQFLRRAIALAERAVREGVGQPFGAVVVQDGRIVGEGCNVVPSRCDPTAHAETVAIRDACQKLSSTTLEGCTIYASCEPCAMCLAAIHLARIARLVFAASAETAATFGFDSRHLYDRLRERPGLPATQLLADEGSVPLRLGARKTPPPAG